MKNAIINSTSSFKQYNTRDVASLKMVVFAMGNLNLALRVDNVYKVLNQTAVYGSGFNDIGITHVGDREVIVVDLHRRLFGASIINGASKKSYLIISQDREGERYGIPVTVVPVLMEIPLSSIRVLPESYRHTDVLGFASHVCHITKEEQHLTIFLLDVKQLLPVS